MPESARVPKKKNSEITVSLEKSVKGKNMERKESSPSRNSGTKLLIKTERTDLKQIAGGHISP